MNDQADSPQEIELKFELDSQALDRLEERLTVRAGAAAPPKPQTLVSVYYDTAEHALQKAGFTLRVRQDGKKHVQTVKSEGDGLFTRGEWESYLDGEALDLKALKNTPLGPMLNDAGMALRPVFATRMNRTRRLIREPAGDVEAALDRGEIEADGRTSPVCELELELKTGQAEAVFGLARRLAETEPLRLSFQSKAERGFGLLAGAPPLAFNGEPASLNAGMTVAEAFAAIGAAGLKQLTVNAQILRAVRRSEAIHQTRVAIRRLRTAFRLFEPAAGDKDAARLNGELRWLAGELDQARDLDVMIADTFRPAVEQFGEQKGLGALGKRLHAARGLAYDRALKALDSPRGLALPLDLAAWLDSGAWRDPVAPLYAARAGAPIDAFTNAALDKLRRQIKRRGKNLKQLDPGSRHKLRIHAKRLRYALEFFAELHVKGGRRDRFAAAVKGLQDALGVLNDMQVVRERGLALAEAGGRASGDSAPEGARQAFAAGLMVGARAKAEKPLLRKAVRLYDELVEAEPYWR